MEELLAFDSVIFLLWLWRHFLQAGGRREGEGGGDNNG